MNYIRVSLLLATVNIQLHLFNKLFQLRIPHPHTSTPLLKEKKKEKEKRKKREGKIFLNGETSSPDPYRISTILVRNKNEIQRGSDTDY